MIEFLREGTAFYRDWLIRKATLMRIRALTSRLRWERDYGVQPEALKNTISWQQTEFALRWADLLDAIARKPKP